MPNVMVQGILLSQNAKTGYSINVDQCTPTTWCREHCYRRRRTRRTIARMGWTSTPNAGPITWPKQVAAYRRNERQIYELGEKGELDAAGAEIAGLLPRLGVHALRGNGTGDLFAPLCELYARIASHGGDVYLYSRRPRQILELAALCDVLGGPRPFVLGSVDPSTQNCAELVEAARRLNVTKPALAYATAARGEAAMREIDGHPYRQYFKVVFGYHASATLTKLGHELECPATAGEGAKCQDCRRCFGS